MVSGGLGLLSLIILAIAIYQTFNLYRIPLFWKSSRATVVDTIVANFHDDEGILCYRIKAKLKYRTSSGEQEAIADSDFTSRDYASVRSRRDQLARDGVVRAYYDSSNPGSARFGAELSAEYLGAALHLFLAFVGIAAMSALPRLIWKAPRACSGCRTKLKHHYRYCTFCGATLSPAAHPIAHERPARV
jgi:hypothetical protein